MKSALEAMLETEMDVHLGRKELYSATPLLKDDGSSSSTKHRRNGHSPKTIQGDLEPIPKPCSLLPCGGEGLEMRGFWDRHLVRLFPFVIQAKY